MFRIFDRERSSAVLGFISFTFNFQVFSFVWLRECKECCSSRYYNIYCFYFVASCAKKRIIPVVIMKEIEELYDREAGRLAVKKWEEKIHALYKMWTVIYEDFVCVFILHSIYATTYTQFFFLVTRWYFFVWVFFLFLGFFF